MIQYKPRFLLFSLSVMALFWLPFISLVSLGNTERFKLYLAIVGMAAIVAAPLFWWFLHNHMQLKPDRRKSLFPHSANDFPLVPNENTVWEGRASYVYGHQTLEGVLRLSAGRLVFLCHAHGIGFMLPLANCTHAEKYSLLGKWLFSGFGLYSTGREFWVMYNNTDINRFQLDNAWELITLFRQLKRNGLYWPAQTDAVPEV